MRLECVKIAANIVIQLKDPKISVVGLAKTFLDFIDAPVAETTFENDDNEIDYDQPTSETPRGTYTKRDLRRHFVRGAS